MINRNLKTKQKKYKVVFSSHRSIYLKFRGEVSVDRGDAGYADGDGDDGRRHKAMVE